MLTKKLITPAATYPLTLAELKPYMSIELTETAWDTVLNAAIAGATDTFETLLGRAIVDQTWQLTCDTWAEALSYFPMGELQSLTSVTYLDDNKASQTVDSTDYDLRGVGTDQGHVRFRDTFTYPSLYESEAITVQYVVGYSIVPNGLKRLMFIECADNLSFRESKIIVMGTTPIEQRLTENRYLMFSNGFNVC